MPAAALANNADPFGFFEEDYSSWGLVDAPYPYDESVARPSRPRAARMAGETPAPPTLAKDDLRYGCFPVGNGLVFAHLGVDDDFNTLRGITGPGYQTRTDDGAVTYWREGNWPDQPLELAFTLGDGDVEVLQYTWTTQSIQQLRGAAMVRTIQRSPGVDLYTLTYAVPGKPIVIRETALFPKGGGKAGDWLLRLSPAGELVEDHKDIIAQGSKRLIGLSLYPNPKGYPRLIHADGAVYQRAFQDDQDARPCVRFAIAYGVYSDNQKPPTLAGVDVDELRRSVYAYWQTWSSRNQKFDTGDPRLDDLMAQLPVIIETQRDAYSGGVAPMVSYHGYWVRDSMGPILAYLANGRFDHVKRMLRYHRAACLQYKQSHMLVPLDLDLSDLPGWLPGDPGTAGDLSQIGLSPADWEGTPVEHAEVPSLIALQHYLLWRGMHKAGLGEAADEFIREAWAFISHNLFAMRFDPDYGVKFHGDETYTHGSLYSTYDRPESGAIGYPNGYIPTDFFSFDNTILHRAAAAAAYEMSEAARDEAAQGKAKELTEQLDGIVNNYYVGSHYAPAISPLTGQKWVRQFANIGLRPFWLDLPYGKLRSNQGISLRESLWRGGRALTTPWTGYATGHSLGYFMHLATSQGDGPFAGRLAGLLLDTASPEGAWCEVLDPDGLPVDIYGRTNRIRPWESGINYFALAQYLGNRESWGYFDYFTQPRPRRAAAVAPEGARLLVLTRDNHYREVTGLDERLRALGQSEITAWDIGLPISHQDLRQALLDGSAALRGGVHGGGPDLVGRAAVPAIIESRTGPSAPPTGQPAPPKLRIPYFYLDRGVRGGLDRRTFKDREFWEGGEMTQLLADYKAAGGQVIDEDSLEITLADDEAVALKVLVVLYPRTFTWEMGEADIARFQQEIAGWVRWYDEVAGDKLHLELDFLQVGRRLPPLASGPRGGEVYWMSWTDVEDDLLARGVPRDYYDSVACFWAWDREAAVENGGTAQQAYGGAAEGPDSDMEFLGGAGRASYFGSAVLKSHPDNVSKVAIHEYLHNLGAMFKSAGLGDRFLSSDDMARNMDKLLAERPGSFEAHGYSDDGMRVLAKKEQRKEDSFPWRTQLIYYRWMLERTAKNDYARLLTRFGKRQPRTPRQRLYNKHLLPEGDDEPYQVWFAEPAAWPEHVSSMRIELLDKDRDDGYVHWRSVAWVGTTAGPGSGAVERYREAELIAPDSIEITLGEGAPKLAVSLDGVDAGQDTSGVQVWAEIGGQRVDLASSGNGGYAAPLPGGIGEPAQITFHAEAYGFVISPLPVELIVRPSWDLAVEFRESSEEEGGLALTVDGPSGGYTLELELATELNSVLARLAVDGLVGPKVEYRTTLRLTPGKEVLIVLDAESLDALKAAGGTVTVEYESPSGESMSFAHRLPALKSTGDLLGKLSEDDLPPYIPRAVRLTPVIDGELGEWPADPAITLTPANGNVFSGSFEREGDAEIELWLAYDDERFYAAGKVRDDMTPGNGIWDSDRLNFCFDARLDSSSATYPGGPVGHTGWEADDYWIFLCPMLADGPKSMCLGGARPTGGRVGYYGPLGDAQAVVVAEDGGYRFEWAIPWASLPHLPPAEGQFTGFTFFLSDYDESLSEVMHVTDWGGPGGIEWRFWDCGLLYFAE